ncbi:MAG TPA: hypothetical protein VGL99_25480 [Chloroflexota bacterium]|jgi:hypothetical protein
MTRGLFGLVGVSYLLTGLALLFAPQWFFDHVGTFPPFNRHFLGDIGSFTLPIGLGLLLSLRWPSLGPGVLLIGVLGSSMHLLNHVYDALLDTVPGRGWSDVPGLVVVLLLLLLPLWRRSIGRPQTRPTRVG